MSSESGESTTRTISLGSLQLNLDNYRTAVGDRLVRLTYDEFELLAVLAKQADYVITYESLAQTLWEANSHSRVRYLNVLVHRLRFKLGDISPYELVTVRNRGYGLVRKVGTEHGG